MYNIICFYLKFQELCKATWTYNLKIIPKILLKIELTISRLIFELQLYNLKSNNFVNGILSVGSIKNLLQQKLSLSDRRPGRHQINLIINNCMPIYKVTPIIDGIF